VRESEGEGGRRREKEGEGEGRGGGRGERKEGGRERIEGRERAYICKFK
jgi:hypothetical protein